MQPTPPSRSARPRLLAALIGLTALASGCASAPQPVRPPAQAAPDAGSPTPDDELTDAFFSALRDGDFAKAAAPFDEVMRQALSPAQLEAVWRSQTGALGALESWETTQRTRVGDDKDVSDVALRFERGELRALLTVDVVTRQLAGLFFKPVVQAAAPASYVNPAAFREEAVEVGAAPYLLPGTLTVPRGDGPFPAVVLVHGSGPNDRDERIGANAPFKDIAEGLSSRGVVVLRYDKRTLRYGKQLAKDISIDDEVVDDAVSAVRLLGARGDVDGKRVFIVGHSLGALLAPEIGQRSAPIAGVVLLAPSGRAPWAIIVAQLRYLGVPADTLAQAEQAASALEAHAPNAGPLLGVPASYWYDLASRDGAAMARRLKRPTLILRGQRDYQVSDEDIAVWREGLKGAPQVEFALIPDANHLFIKGAGKPGPAEYNVAGHVDATVVERLVSFIAANSVP